MGPFVIGVGVMLLAACSRGDYTVEELRCEVCKSIVREMEDIVDKVASTALVSVGSHRLDEKGNPMSTAIPLVHSESFLVETMESACDRMQDYARGYDKKTHRLRVVRMKSGEKMSLEMSQVNPISDADLNESLKYHCEDITDKHENDIIRVFRMVMPNKTSTLCIEETHLCQPPPAREDL